MTKTQDDAPTKNTHEDSIDDGYVVDPSGEIDPSLLHNESANPVASSAPALIYETFESAELSPKLLDAIKKIGWTKPTPVQSLCLPHTLKGKHVAGFAQTGTGKTGVFLTTFANKWLADETQKTRHASKTARPFSVVLAPTRELAIQIHEDAAELLNPLGAKSMAVFGGVDYGKQIEELSSGIDLIVATPGRLKDFFKKKIISLDFCQLFVCDEVDRMFEMGFVEDVEYFLEKLPENGQRLLFSATTNDKVKELAFEYLDKPEYISVNPEVLAPEKIEQHAILCDTTNKFQVLLGLLETHKPNRAVIFCNTKLVCQWLHYKLKGNGIGSDLITGDLPQNKRINLIRKIKEGNLKFLIATDVASRGLHISGITHVYNFDIPDEAANYVHRIGRTARAGAEGASYSLVCEEYGENFDKIKTLLADAAPKSEWFDEAFLKIEDKAGNPFDDNFGVKIEPKTRSNPTRRNETRSGASADRQGQQGTKGGRGTLSSSNKNHRPEKGRGEANTREDTRKRSKQNSRNRNSHNAETQHSKASRANTSNNNRNGSKTTAPEEPTSTGSIIKRVFSVLFGRKKNK